jgi:hypothetical protein
MFNPEKLVVIINHVNERLKTQASYRLGVNLLQSELTELRKHFNVTLGEPYGDFDNTYIFTSKEADA